MTRQSEYQNEQEAIMKYETELNSRAQDKAMANQYAATTFPNMMGQKQNLIEWELDFKPELESIERLLRCDVLVKDKEGNEFWAQNPDSTKIFLNEQGVSDLIRNIIILVNKNKALSNYTADEINDRVRQMKHEIRVLIYNNYETYGMDNEYKMNNYSMIVLSIGSIIEDVYRRAMGGSTHRGLNEQRIVQQSEPLLPSGSYPSYNNGGSNHGGGKKFSILPWRWKNS